jgi:hypothetical protein
VHACSITSSMPTCLQVHLELLQLQLLVWTSGKYERVMVDNPTLDTSAALSGTDASFQGLLSRLDNCMDFLLQAVETLWMRAIVRGAAEASLRQARTPPPPMCLLRGSHAYEGLGEGLFFVV